MRFRESSSVTPLDESNSWPKLTSHVICYMYWAVELEIHCYCQTEMHMAMHMLGCETPLLLKRTSNDIDYFKMEDLTTLYKVDGTFRSNNHELLQ